MIPRRASLSLKRALGRQAVVGLLGPRQVGKTTLAHELVAGTPALYLDLESRADREKLADPALFLRSFADRLVILDEVHRVPELFATLRGLVDEGRRQGRRTGQFLVLGSATIDLLRQSSESLAGRIEFVFLNPLDVLEATGDAAVTARLWLRGGFPDSFLAATDDDSLAYRRNFIRTYLERDVPQFGPRIPAESLERLWTMLAHGQGGLLNAAPLAAGLGVTATTVGRYVDLLVDLMLVRRLRPWHVNVGKRLVKAPKLYVRDSGLLHALLGLGDLNALAGHPVVGTSWEGFVIENLLAVVPEGTVPHFYRTTAGAEIDLVLALPGQPRPWAIEVKRASAPRLERGFHHAIADLDIERAFVVYAGDDRYPMAQGIEAIGLREMAALIAAG